MVPHSESIVRHPHPWPVYDASTIARTQSLIAQSDVFDYGRGPMVGALENWFSDLHDGRLALSFNSGTSALYAAYSALGWRNGAEVLVSTLTFMSTASPLLALGAVPVLCDVSSADGNLDAEDVARRITPHTKGIVVTHLFGNPCDMTEIRRLADRHGLAVVEDCSHAHASLDGDRPVGLHGDVAVFSLGSQKLISGGHGGILTTSREDVFDHACLLGHFKHRSRASVIDPRLRVFADFGLGGNLRIGPIAASLAYGHALQIAEISERRGAAANQVLEAAKNALGLQPLHAAPGRTNRTWFDIVGVMPDGASAKDRDALVAALGARGLLVRAPSTAPLNVTSLFQQDPSLLRRLGISEAIIDATRGQGSCPTAESLHDRAVSFPSAYFHEGAQGVSRVYADTLAAMPSTSSGR